jgi:hypothetical protein
MGRETAGECDDFGSYEVGTAFNNTYSQPEAVRSRCSRRGGYALCVRPHGRGPTAACAPEACRLPEYGHARKRCASFGRFPSCVARLRVGRRPAVRLGLPPRRRANGERSTVGGRVGVTAARRASDWNDGGSARRPRADRHDTHRNGERRRLARGAGFGAKLQATRRQLHGRDIVCGSGSASKTAAPDSRGCSRGNPYRCALKRGLSKCAEHSRRDRGGGGCAGTRNRTGRVSQTGGL